MSNEELVISYQNGNKQALEQLIENNQKFIYKIANKFYTEGISSIDKEDLIQEGAIGFIIACNKYDINNEKKALFITYAFHWIYSKIHRFITSRDTNEEISLNKPVGEEDKDELLNLLESHEDNFKNIEDKLYLQELREDLENVMTRYNTMREREVLKLFYGWDIEPVTSEGIADLLKTSSSDIKNIKNKAIRKIRNSMWFKKEYNKRFKYDITFGRVLRNIEFKI